MPYEIILALATFAFVSSITPGPNNLMLMASGANFGFRRTIPHMLGVGLGFVFMTILVGAGLMQMFDAWPPSYAILKMLSVVYMLYLAWRIATAAAPKDATTGAEPLSFLQAAAFQWVNPKAWAMALTAISAYAPDRSTWSILLVAVIFGAINLPSVSCWTVLGTQMRRLLSKPAYLTSFNYVMALLLVATLWPVVMG